MNRSIIGVSAMATVLLLGAACGGKDATPLSTRTDNAASLGSADGSATGTSAVATSPSATNPAAARAADLARAVATAQATAQAQAQTPGVDPCRILTQEELETALGFPLEPGKRGTSAIGAAECAYKARSGQTPGTMPDVTVAIYKSRLARTTYDVVRESGSSATDVPGLGDKAFVVVSSGLLDNREINVLKGEALLSIEVTRVAGDADGAARMSSDEKRSKLIALARTALGRL